MWRSDVKGQTSEFRWKMAGHYWLAEAQEERVNLKTGRMQLPDNGWAMPRTIAGFYLQIRLDVESVRFNASTQLNCYVDSYVRHI